MATNSGHPIFHKRGAARQKIRHVLVSDGDRGPGWYVVDTSRRPPRTLAKVDSRADAEAWIAEHKPS